MLPFNPARFGNVAAIMAPGSGITPPANQITIDFLARTSGLDTAHTNAYTAFIDGLVTDAVVASGTDWTPFDGLYLFATQDQTTALLNLPSATYNGTNVNSLSFTADQGFTGTNTAYLDTNFNPTTATSPNFGQDSAFTMGWSLTSLFSGGGIFGTVLGLISGGVNSIYPRYTNDTAFIRANCSADINPASTDGKAFWAVNRTANNLQTAYKDAVSIGTDATASSASNNSKFIFMSDGTRHWDNQCAAGAFGSKLTGTQITNFYNRLHDFLHTVGAV